MVVVMVQTVLLMLLVGYVVTYNGVVGQDEDVLITPEECEVVAGLHVGGRCYIDYSTIKSGNASEPGADLLITSDECKLVNGLKVDGRCWINPLNIVPESERCPYAYLKTPSGCIGTYFNASCLPLENGLKVDDLCVIIKKSPEVEAKPKPQVPQYKFEDAVIIPNSTYQKDGNNGFKPLTKSENYYVQSVCGQAKAPRARIFNGKTATRGQFPWIVNFDYCTGVLISPRHVLTAAHCFYQGDNAEAYGACKPVSEDDIVNYTSIWYGGVCKWDDEDDCPNGSDMNWTRTHRVMYGHDNPTICVVQNDIAIVLLNEDVEFNDYVKPICLGNIAHDNFVNVKTAGFGYTDRLDHQTNILRYINTNIVKYKKREINTRATDASTCAGDSGGPTQASFNGSSRTYLAGITSRGVCNSEGETTSTFVPAYVDWVCQQTGVCDLS